MFQRLVSVILKVLMTIFIILVIVIFLVQTPFVQNIIRSKAEKYLSRKLNTRVGIGRLYINFPTSILLGNIYLEDRHKDTLLSAGLINVNIRMWGLLHHTLDLRDVQLDDLTIKIQRRLPDTVFNFQFIADAFAGEPAKEPPPPNTSPMKMSLGALSLDKIRLVYKDTVTGNDIEVWIDHSLTTMQTFDPANLHFDITRFRVKGLRAKVWQGQPLGFLGAFNTATISAAAATRGSATGGSVAPSSTAPPTPLRLQLDKIDLENSQLDYRNTVSAFSTSLDLGRLTAELETFDLDNRIIRLKEVRLDSTTTALRIGKLIQHSTFKIQNNPAAASSPDDWRITAAGLQLNADNLRYDDDNQPRQKAGMDYAHLQLNQLTLHAAALAYNKDSISGVLTKGQFRERSGFQLLQLQTSFLYTDRQASLKGLLLRTPGTLLQRNALLQYSSLADIMKDPAHTLLDLDLSNSKVQVKDILTFAPSLRTLPAFSQPSDTWQLNTRMKGSLANLNIGTLQFSGLRDLRLDLSGIVRNMMNTKKVSARLNIRMISGSRSSLVALLPPKTLPANISIPERFKLHGLLDGGMDSVKTDLVLNTSSGTVLLKGMLQQFRDPRRARYDLVLHTQALDLGYILQDPQDWGRVTAGFTVKGQGLDLPDANAHVSGRIDSATFRQYPYRDLSFDGSVADQHATLQSSIRNTAISFVLNASADLSRKFPAVQLDWQIDTLDLRALHLVHDTLQLHAHLVAGFDDIDPDSLQGKLSITGLSMVNGSQQLHTDSITLSAQHDNGLEDIRLRSEMADLDFNGKYRLTELPQAIQHTISRYYRLNGSTDSLRNPGDLFHSQKDSAFTAQDWTMQLHFRPSPLVLAYMPTLRGTDTLGARLTFNSDNNDLQLDLRAPRIQFGTQTFQQLRLTAATRQDQLQYALQIASGNGSGFELHQTDLQGYLAHDRLFSDLTLKDGKGKNRYRVAGQLDKLKDGIKFILNPDSLLLNYEAWQVSRDNFFQYDAAGIVVNDFTINKKDESLRVSSTPPAPHSPIEISFTNFQVSTLSRFADQDSLSVDGVLNGKAEVKNVLSTPVFTSDLQIKGLTYKKDSLGDLAIKVNNEKGNAFSADLSLEGNNNDIKVKGEYYTGESRFDLKLDLQRLNLASFRRVAEAEVENMKGALKGSLAITGTMDKPLITGNLHFDSARITPAISGEPLKLSNDKIEFDADGFNFSKFSMQDSAGNKATIDGNVYTHDYRDFSFDVSLNAANFRLVNAQPANSRQFYGKMNLDAAVNLTGDKSSPKVDGDLRVNKKTNFFFVLPGSDPEVADREGVIRFVDKEHPGDTLVDAATLALHARQSDIKGMDIGLRIQTDSNAVFTIVIDERTGDQLTARGRSNLVFGMDKSGKIDLTGGYEVESGSYNLSLDVLKRKFDIQHGSMITWTGDPTTATLDLTATYMVNTPSIDLISNEIAGRSAADINKFKQKLPFLITLKMEGELLKPKITFDITLPPDVLTLYPDVDAKLQQIRNEESELNKQVFALLLLNRFVGDDPLQSAAGGGSSVGNMAFQSASQILTDQLDRLAGSLIKGVDIHFDLNNQQDFSTGSEIDYTEANVSVSKKLFNERIQVEVGSNFDVMGTGAPNQNASNIAGNVAVDYKLTKDGRYMLRAYRKNQYEAVIEGQVVETGVSFILTFDYNKLKEIFGRTKEEELEERRTIKPAPAKPSNQ